MRLLHAAVGAGLVVGGLHASGILASGTVYPKPFSEAYAELASTPVPPMAASMFGGDCHVRRKADAIEWHFVRDGNDVAIFTAALSAEDARHTRVIVDFEVGPAMDEESGRLIGTQFMTNTARLAMAEQVDAELHDRPFNQLRFGQLLAEHYQANPGELKEYGNALNDIFIETSDQMRAFDRPAGTLIPVRPPTEAATRPSTVLPAS